MKWKPYPKYKSSGLEWIGKVPEHWVVQKIKYSVRFTGGGTPSKDVAAFWNGDIPWVSPKDMKLERIIDSEDHITDAALRASATSIVPVGTVLLVVRSGILRHTIPVAIAEAPVALNQDMKGLTSRSAQLEPWFLVRWIQGLQSELITCWTKQGATVESLEQEYIVNTLLPVPPRAEQLSALKLLERETSKIDTLIAKQERLIELLQEKRQSLISHAVTKGLNPNASMKPSGLDWLGDVPEHWGIVRHKSVFREVDERSISDEGTLLTVSHITGITPRSEKNVNMFLAETLEGYKLCLAGDLVINTMWAWMGALGISKHDGLVSPSYNVYRPRDYRVLHPSYFDYLCRIPSYVVNLKAHSTGVWESRLRLYPDVFLASSVCLPPLSEQVAIAKFLDGERSKIDVLVEKANGSIALMHPIASAAVPARNTLGCSSTR